MFADVNGIKLYYEKRGVGDNIIMVHGNGEDHNVFENLASELEKHFTVWLPDSRGHGKSSPVKEYHYADMARDMAGFIQNLGLERPLYLGASDGGITGLILASEYPLLLSGLVVCGANTRPGGLKFNFYIKERIKQFFKYSPLSALMLNEPHITKKELEKIKVPTLIIAGEKDLIKESDTRFIAAGIKGAKLRIFNGEGHSSYITKSFLLTEEVSAFAFTCYNEQDKMKTKREK